MILLIDGYNVIKQAMLKSKITERERDKFIKQLSKYHEAKGHNIKLVFDGGPFDFPTKEKISGIYVIYVGAQESADDYIKRYLSEHKALDILLVSSDRDICRHASRLGIEQIDAKEFYAILQSALKKGISGKLEKQTVAVKTTDKENKELDALMQEASKVMQYKTEDFTGSADDARESKSHKLPKKERKKLKKIKKL
ncbi:NYN domain-containing protein [Candidatus Dependentiae bacterium]